VVIIGEQEVLDEIIEVLTRLLIQQDFIDKEKSKKTYVKKTRVYKDLLDWFKEMKEK